VHEDGTVEQRSVAPSEGTTLAARGDDVADDDASTKGMHSSHNSRTNVDGVAEEEEDLQAGGEGASDDATTVNDADGKSLNGVPNGADGLERPVQAAAGEETDAAQAANAEASFSFANKRLCERWLDNLFMVLYEDLRVWTIFRAEVAHFKTQHVAYRKTGLEWEILGDLAVRLHHKEEAKEAYQRCLDSQRYSQKPWAKLLETYAEEGDITRTIQTAIRVAAYQYADYTEMTYPTLISRSFFRLGQIHGHAKIAYTLLSMGLPEQIMKIMNSFLEYGKTFKVEGYDF